MLWCFHNGWNLRAGEPNLTLAQVLAPALPGTILLFQLESPEAQAALVLTTVVPLLYGMFDLGMGGFIVAAIVYSVGYWAVILGSGLPHAHDGLVSDSWLLLISLAIVMPQVVLLGALVNRLRRKLHERNQDVREAMARISAMATRDHLTGLHNRRWLMDVLESELARCQRAPYTFYVAIIDVDHFKRINDTYGHAAGDRVLKHLARLMTDSVREVDSFGRFGGEEFVWVIPATDLAGAAQAAGRLCHDVAEPRFTSEDGAQFAVTLSIGLAQNDSDQRQGNDTLLRYADEALYKAKKGGRNCVIAAAVQPPPSPPTEYAELGERGAD